MCNKKPIKNNDANIAKFHINLVDLPDIVAHVYVTIVPIIITDIPTIAASIINCKL